MTTHSNTTKASTSPGIRSALFSVLLAAASLGGCASLTSHYAGAQIDSDPQGAEVVYVDTGVVLGRTPFTYWWETGSSEKKFINVRFQKPGYEDKTTAFYITPRHGSHQEALNDPHHVKVNLEKAN